MPHTLFPKSARFETRADLVIEQVDDEYLILDLAGNKYFGLNAVARCIWMAIEKGHSFGEVVNAVVTEFHVDRNQVATDAADFIVAAQDQGLVTRADTRSASHSANCT